MLQAIQKFVDDDSSGFFDRIEKVRVRAAAVFLLMPLRKCGTIGCNVVCGMQFCMDCIDDLPDAAAPARQSSHDSVAEYPPAYLAAHRRYIDVVESSIEQFLTEQGYSLREVAAALAASEGQADAVYR